jgi:hypothetical protein
MTTPSGKLMWGQAGAYDGVDDRAVIAAVSGFRTGLVNLPVITAGTGLNLTVRAGWAGIADCGDGTSAVVGARTDQTVTALPGPATGSRTDYIWCDVQPDAGTWSLTVINATAAAGRSGLPVATLTVPANASLASQMSIAPVTPSLERRMLAFATATETNTRTGNSFATVGAPVITPTVTCLPGRWYRVRFSANSIASLSGGPDLRAAIGQRTPGQADAAATQVRGWTIAVPATNRPMGIEVTHTFLYPAASAPVQRQYDGRVWITGTGSLRTCYTSGINDGLQLSVEDMGT